MLQLRPHPSFVIFDDAGELVAWWPHRSIDLWRIGTSGALLGEVPVTRSPAFPELSPLPGVVLCDGVVGLGGGGGGKFLPYLQCDEARVPILGRRGGGGGQGG